MPPLLNLAGFLERVMSLARSNKEQIRRKREFTYMYLLPLQNNEFQLDLLRPSWNRIKIKSVDDGMEKVGFYASRWNVGRLCYPDRLKRVTNSS